MKKVSRIYTILCFVILYAPVAVMILFSFNSSDSIFAFDGFSTQWYKSILNGGEAVDTLINSLILAALSAVISTVVGTAAALGIFHMKKKWLKNAVMQVTNIPMMNPDIVTGISMMLLFITVGMLIKVNILGFWTILIAHITFSLPYVILSVLPKLRQLDPHLTEAALDLGCTPMQAFLKVELPAILSGIISGMIMAFTLSLDDFVISYFTTGASFKTFPTYIYSLVKKPFKPNIYALSTIMTVAVLVLLIISNVISSRDNSGKPAKRKERKSRKERKGEKA
ncbi:MAG: ABC transporter permease [Eubacteriales bacterium]